MIGWINPSINLINVTVTCTGTTLRATHCKAKNTTMELCSYKDNEIICNFENNVILLLLTGKVPFFILVFTYDYSK